MQAARLNSIDLLDTADILFSLKRFAHSTVFSILAIEERLCEARAIVSTPRDRSPEELEIWVKHVTAARDLGKPLALALPDMHKELLQKGFVQEGWWDTLLKDIEIQTRGT